MRESLKNMINQKGQVLPYMLIMSLILILSWAMMLNIAKIIRDKMILQNNTDNAVLSIANLQARTLNMLGLTNNLMATVLSTAGYPESFGAELIISAIEPKSVRDKVSELFHEFPMKMLVPSFSTDKIGGSLIPGPFCDHKCNSIGAEYKGVKMLRDTVNIIRLFQETLIDMYAVNYINLMMNFSKGDNVIVVLPSRYVENIKNFNFSNFNISSISPTELLGIKKNSKGIKYYKTKNYCLNSGVLHLHFVTPEQYKTDKYSWYVQDENFYDKKLVAIGTKVSGNNENYPYFKNIFKVQMPQLLTYAAAGVYNTAGEMIPDKESVYTGVNLVALSSLILLAKQSQMLITAAAELSEIPVAGWICAAILIGLNIDMLATSAINYVNAKDDKNTPIYKYNKAKNGGWDAHLVPL